MKPAPRTIHDAQVIQFSPLDARHKHTGNCRQIVGGVLQGPAAGLAICQYRGDSSFYLFGCNANWEPITDTCHLSLEEAKQQAEFEYEGISRTWGSHDDDSVSTAELCVSLALDGMLSRHAIGESIEDDASYLDLLNSLERFLVEILRGAHSAWLDESLDGILPRFARRTGEREAEIAGECILIRDQAVVPFHLLLQTDVTGDRISYQELKLGKLGPQGMIRTPYSESSKARALAISEIEWAYHVAFGQRLP
jgi:hypothetical protein